MQNSRTTAENAIAFVLGAVAGSLPNALGGWWLNSGAGVLRVAVILFALGLVVAFLRSGPPWLRAAWLWAGAMAGTTAALFWLGPGRIWPIVLVVAAVATAAAIFAGASVGRVVNKIRRQP
jgi:hypothetical protein